MTKAKPAQSCATCIFFSPPTGKAKYGMCQWFGHDLLAAKLFQALPDGVLVTMQWRWPKIPPSYGKGCRCYRAGKKEGAK